MSILSTSKASLRVVASDGITGLEPGRVDVTQREESILSTITEPITAGCTTARLNYMDNLRWTMIFLVVAVHSACTYSGYGSWYYVERSSLPVSSQLFFGLFLSLCQGFFMGFLFFLAGFFVPSSYDRKGPARFLRDRFVRLGIPSLLYMLFVHPLTGRYLLHWPKDNLYWRYSSGPMWFAVALFLFSVIYVGWKALRPGALNPAPIVPKWRHIWATGAVITILAFLIRTVQPIGTNVYNMQLCYFAQYVVLFALGIMARRRGWIEQLENRMAFTALALGALAGPVLWVAMVLVFRTMPNGLRLLNGGWNVYSAINAFWESFYCVTICTGLLGLYRSFCNHRGKVAAFLSDNSFGVYFIHPPILIAITLLMKPYGLPVVPKFAVASVAAILFSYFVSLVLRRLPLLRRIL
jgi:fucose 4-O-acetylase-like acetyltransferase